MNVRLKLSQNITAAVIVLAGGISLVCSNSIKLMRMYGYEFKTHWTSMLFSRIEETGIEVAAAMLIIAGIYGIRKKGFGVMRSLMALAGIVLCGWFAIQGFYMYYAISKISNEMGLHDKIIIKNLESQMTDRTKPIQPLLSYHYAAQMFEHEGVMIEYYAPDGKKTLFRPDQENIRAFERTVLMKAGVHNHYRYLEYVFQWITILVIGVLTGMLIPVASEQYGVSTE